MVRISFYLFGGIGMNDYLILFFYDVSILYGDTITLDEDFYLDMMDFFIGIYQSEVKEIINKMFDIGEYTNSEECFIIKQDNLANYMNNILSNSDKLRGVFNSVSVEDGEVIGSLAGYFVNYINIIRENGIKRIKQ
jgi:hypothetical protein